MPWNPLLISYLKQCLWLLIIHDDPWRVRFFPLSPLIIQKGNLRQASLFSLADGQRAFVHRTLGSLYREGCSVKVGGTLRDDKVQFVLPCCISSVDVWITL